MIHSKQGACSSNISLMLASLPLPIDIDEIMLKIVYWFGNVLTAEETDLMAKVRSFLTFHDMSDCAISSTLFVSSRKWPYERY